MSPVNTRVQEPSMEEILASIRRIIADDQDRVLPARFAGGPIRPVIPAAMPQQVFDAEEDDLAEDLAEDSAGDDEAAPLGGKPMHEIPATANLAAEPETAEADEPAEVPVPPQAHASTEPAPRIPLEVRQESPAPAGRDEPLLSPQVHAAAGQAFQRLAATAHPRPALTMEEHVTEMLRPMLRAWLDENLPAIVERLVEAEIERIRRGR